MLKEPTRVRERLMATRTDDPDTRRVAGACRPTPALALIVQSPTSGNQHNNEDKALCPISESFRTP